MAAKEVKKATDNLSCPVCYQLFKNPKYLPCHHSYCEECLEKIQVRSKIKCPECRREAAVPAGGVKDFDNAFFINRMVDEFVLKRKVEGEAEVKCDECDEDEPVVGYCPDCNLFFCHICNESHKRNKRYRGHGIVPLAELKSHKDVSIQLKPKVPVCREHEYELKHYCESCDVLVCLYCTMKEHNGHSHDTVKKVVDKHRKELKEITAPVDEMIKGLAETHLNITDRKEKIRKHGEDMNKEIDQHYDRVIQKLIEQRDQLKQQVHSTLSQEGKVVTAQLEEIEYAQVETMSMKELNDALEKSSDQEVLSAKKQVTDQMQQMTNKYKKLKVQPVQSATIKFVPTKQQFPLFGLVYSTARACNGEMNDIPGDTIAGKEVRFTIITKDDKGCRCYQEDNQVSVHLGVKATTQIKDNKDGSYIASFNTLRVGQVKVSVLVNGKHIEGSPYSVIVSHHYTSISKPSKIINNNGCMGQPWAIGFSRSGKWAVTDFSNNCVYLYDGEDQLVKKIGGGIRSSNNGHFSGPQAVAFDDDDHLYIGDCLNHRVQKFNNDGDYLMHFGKSGNENGHLQYPKGLTIHNDKVYVADSGNKHISVFLTNGTFHQIIGRQHVQLNHPLDVAITSNDQLLVVDIYYHCIYRFTLDGNYIGKFSSPGADKGHLNRPYSITVDPTDLILVADSFNHRVSIFDQHGNHIHSFGTKGTDPGQFNVSLGVALNWKGDIYIGDHENKRIQIFSDW
ncbi:E3 ubiquitin-protein ligase TRIM71-like [Dysidea avara]|uniref:E3 ubiquitin-protein ligase TRIM71-like n=1 Tax=Dysidea avara TaxID=196820 RepID=UPI00331A9B5C